MIPTPPEGLPGAEAQEHGHRAPAFVPFTGFDPCDGFEPHVDLSRDNPCSHVSDHLGGDDPDGRGGVAAGRGFHGGRND